MKSLTTLIAALTIYVITAPPLQVWVLLHQGMAHSPMPSAHDLYHGLPPWTRLVQAYNYPLSLLAGSSETARHYITNYDRWLAQQYMKYYFKP